MAVPCWRNCNTQFIYSFADASHLEKVVQLNIVDLRASSNNSMLIAGGALEFWFGKEACKQWK